MADSYTYLACFLLFAGNWVNSRPSMVASMTPDKGKMRGKQEGK